MPRTQLYITINGRRAFAGWSDDPMAAALLVTVAENDRLRAALARVEHLNVVATNLFAAINGASGETEDAVVAFITDIRAAMKEPK